MTTVLGIDIGKDTLDVVLLRGGHQPESGQFDNTPAGHKLLWRFLKKRGGQATHVCMEATGLYYEHVADFLHDKGTRVSVVNPARIQAYAASQLRRNKTDRLDAATIADFARTQQPPPWIPPSAAWRHLRALARHLADLQEDLQRQRHRLHARQQAAQPVATVVDNLAQQIALLQAQIEQVEQTLQAHIEQFPDLKRDRDLLVSIQGIGSLTAAKLLAELPPIALFENVRDLVAFAGLNPRQRQSGTSLHGRTPISKMGSAAIRAAL